MSTKTQAANEAANENLHIYQQLRDVPTIAQKPFTGKSGFRGTDINPMWRIKRMTEVFGPIGIGWYYEVVNRSMEKSLDNETLCTFVSINLYVKNGDEWSKPIYGEGGNTFCEKIFSKKLNAYIMSTSDEAYKMALTDAISNATKQLGLGADVWFENDKKYSTKYDLQTERSSQQQTPQQQPAPQQPAAPAQQPVPQQQPAPANNGLVASDRLKVAIAEMTAANSKEAVNAVWAKYGDLQGNNDFIETTKTKAGLFS